MHSARLLSSVLTKFSWCFVSREISPRSSWSLIKVASDITIPEIPRTKPNLLSVLFRVISWIVFEY